MIDTKGMLKARSRSVLVLAVAGALASTSAWAGPRTSKQEAAGVGTGAAIGAAAGGPVGFIIGAAFGGWLGDRFHEEKEMRLAAEADSVRSRAEASELESRLDASRHELAGLETTLAAERRANRTVLEQALDVAVYFRTGESGLDEESSQRLTRIAGLLTPMDGVFVRLSGFADKRGDEQYNEQLSAERAQAVRQVFLAAGFPDERLSLGAEGERYSVANENDVDALALERRVTISIDNGAGELERVAQE